MKVRTHLAMMAVVILVPVTVLLGLALSILLEEHKQAARNDMKATARAIALAVDQELAVAETSLRVLATSSHIGKGELATFYGQAVVARTSDTAWILLFDRDGQQLINTRFPAGEVLPRRSNPERVTEVIRTQRASVSDLYIGALTRRPIVTVDVPVPFEQGQRYVLTQSFFPEYFERGLGRLPAGWSAALVDGKGAVISSSPRIAPGTVVDRPPAGESGESRYRDAKGEEIEAVRVPSQRSPWAVLVTAPVELLYGPARRAVVIAGLGIAGAFFAAFLVAAALGRSLAKAISSVAETAASIGSRRVRPNGTRTIDEVDQVRKVLAEVQAERERLLQSEKSARELAEARNEAKDDFLAMLAHELRNPLAAIGGAAAVMNAAGGLPDTVSRARDVIARQAANLKRIVEDLIDTRRVLGSKVRLQLERVDLAEAVRRCVATLEASGAGKQHEIIVSAQPAWVDADVTRLDQIVTNLLGNAIKYTPPGGRIEAAVTADQEHAVLTVRDNGIGIPAELLPRIFDPFVQGARDSHRPSPDGLGVGLAVVRQLALMHGGTIRVESDGVEQGSAFTVRLPLKAAPAAAAMGERRKCLAGRRVLVADGHDDARRMMRLLLESHGCAVVEASDGGETIELARREMPDLALVDENLGNPGLHEVGRSLKDSRSMHGLRLVALTASCGEGAMSTALESGFDDCLVKPVEPDELLDMIEQLPGQARAG